MRRWAPRWSGPERDATLAEVKRCFADPEVLDAALGYYRDSRPGGEPRELHDAGDDRRRDDRHHRAVARSRESAELLHGARTRS